MYDHEPCNVDNHISKLLAKNSCENMYSVLAVDGDHLRWTFDHRSINQSINQTKAYRKYCVMRNPPN